MLTARQLRVPALHISSRHAQRAPRCRQQHLAVTALFNVGGLGLGNKEVYVTGGRGQVAMRIIQKLLQAGKKVSAVVPDEEEAKSVLEFAKTFKFLDKKAAQGLKLLEVDPTDQDALAAALTRAGTVVVVVGDSLPYKSDSKATLAALAAAQEASVGRVLLVGPRSAGGGGFLGGLFGGGGGSPEKVLQGSGLSYAILRTGKPDFEAQGSALGELALGPEGSLQGSISLDQIGEAAAALVQQAPGNVVVEAWSSADAEATPAAELLSQVLADSAAADEPEEDDEGETPATAPQQRPGKVRGRSVREDDSGLAEGDERGEQKAIEQAKKARGGSFMRSAGDRAEDTYQEAAPPPRGFFGMGGGNKVSPSAQDAQQSAAKGLKASGKDAGRKAKAVAWEAGGEGAEKKAGGFLQRLGLGSAVDVDES